MVTLLGGLLDSHTLLVSALQDNRVLSLSNQAWSSITLPTPRGIAVGSMVAIACKDGMYIFRPDGTRAATYHYQGVEAHEAVYSGQGELIIAAPTRSGLALIDMSGLHIVWRIPGVDDSNDSRSYINGVALKDGMAAYATTLGISNTATGWREEAKNRRGALIDIATNKVVLHNLFMPHSPRWRNGAVWFLNSGDGQLCKWTPGDVSHTVVATFPGFSRGLCFLDDTHVVIGVSQGRITAFPNLTIDPLAQPGISLIDVTTGKQIEFEPLDVQEIFDIQLSISSLKM